MKANWTKDDILAMAAKPLSFTDEDVELITGAGTIAQPTDLTASTKGRSQPDHNHAAVTPRLHTRTTT